MKIKFPILGTMLLYLPLLQAQQTPKGIADSLFQLGNYTKAINAYAKVGDEHASLQIARAYATLKNTEKAIRQYQGLVEKYAENTLAWFELGKLYDKTKKFEEAQNVFQKLTDTGRDNPEFYYYLGKSLQATLAYDKAVPVLKKAISLDSTHVKSIFLLGKYFVGAELPSNATEILDLGLRTAPNDVGLINLKALNHFNLGDYQEAASLFQRLVELNESKPFVLKKLGYSYTQIGEYDGAKKTYRALEQMMNQEGDAYFGLGEVFLKEMQADSAEFYFKKAIEERQYIFDKEYRNLGRAARLQGNLKKSLDYYTKAWEENRTNPLAYWQVCVLADEYYKDPKVKLKHYETLVSDFDKLYPFLKERAKKRIKEQKAEIHFNTD